MTNADPELTVQLLMTALSGLNPVIRDPEVIHPDVDPDILLKDIAENALTGIAGSVLLHC
jgi:hypothetical protein